ncbi:hypothetical protein ACFV27_25760 [Streptomyces antimycoticus]|uniref:Uncharacterized protein n=1 Tax=Streptomyces malaysiensis subsp. samsunensis TaxID=459658 RepID=A0A9X2M6J3_STRMQ|nr:hypothetical protein [Streptomyces samsunensis]MCQ8835986.1 hypothetical protein [Streptomyces samsunensis]
MLVPYVCGMRTWIGGSLDWSSRTKRYQSQPGAFLPQPASYLERDLVVAGQ